MAKRRSKKKGSHRRRRIGGVRSGMMGLVTKAGAVVAGAAGAAFVNAAVKKSLSTAPAFTGGALAVAAGIMLPKFVKSPIMESVGAGMIAAGGLFILNETFLSIPGISGIPVMPGAPAGFVRNTVGMANTTYKQGGRSRLNGLDSLKTVGAIIDN